MLQRHLLACIFTVLGMLYLGPSSAATLSFSPSSPTANVGDTFNVDIVISNLPPNDLFGFTPVGAFQLIVNFDAQVLRSTNVLFSNALGSPFDVPLFTADNIAGEVDAANTSLLFDFELAPLQGPSFTLATLSFEALTIGTSSLVFDPSSSLFADAFDPTSVLAVTEFKPGEVSVVPLPGAIWLMITGLLGIGAMARRRKAAA